MIAALLSVIVSLVALSSATYAWYVSNSNVEAQTANVAAMANGMMLQIVAGTKPDHGKDNETIAFDTTGGHEISPSSTDDIKTWYVPSAWSDGAMVSGYSIVNFQMQIQVNILLVKMLRIVRNTMLIMLVPILCIL